MKVEVICYYCRCSIGWKEFIDPIIGSIQKPVTHGVFQECFDREVAKIQAMAINKTNK